MIVKTKREKCCHILSVVFFKKLYLSVMTVISVCILSLMFVFLDFNILEFFKHMFNMCLSTTVHDFQ